MDDQIPQPEQDCEQESPGYFTKMDRPDQMRDSLAAVYSQLLIVEKRNFFQIQPQWPYAQSGVTMF
ncbi:hypothetical protein [Dyadobacter sp. CY347]|uniref:hypothetical protein n=1 Tax=Dyadobacter sp. CY347 TaxID=2909336 RepID=UPI001F2B9579|nr:hypothetical protein [Dyadobacter sp. CY347]MCF2488062.1 hypothetical protein [Dyadobacter sp. CY347]